MHVGVFFPTKEHGTIDEMVALFAALREQGFTSGWLPQSLGLDALTLLAIVGREVDGLELGTSVVPTYPRHPISLAAQALTANAATGGRLRLGIGLSHKAGIEGRYGLSYEKPARHMREYLSVLMPLLADRRVDFEGETLTGKTELTVAGATAPPVFLAALQPLMLKLAGAEADGTITWCTGPVTIEEQVVPIITKAAADAGRPAPRVVVALPAIVTNDEADGRVKAGLQLEGYENIPVYRAVLDREGVHGPADISVVGDEASFAAQVKRLEDIGATDFVAIPCGTAEERDRTQAYLASLIS
ncbi:MAG: TIGR03564 family F420-dependent LLM class oxidoreductase [Acidobacteria bacterium]|nr:TIGR03564 family F420-dependent LLM class oxidoreductase [Acidobacteriota bacterium]